jgi:serine/threonine-protein kinase RsbW
VDQRLAARASGRRIRPAHFELGPGEAADERHRMAWVDALEELTLLIAGAGGLSWDRACDFGVAVREALVNALKHGTDAACHRVAVGFRLVDGPALLVTVRDRGPGFDPGAVPDPRTPENLCRNSGRGVFYMRRFADAVAFSFPRRGGTVTRLRKHLPPRLAASRDPGLEEWMGPIPTGSPNPDARAALSGRS